MSKVALLQKIGEEYDTAKVNRVSEEYESYIDLLDSVIDCDKDISCDQLEKLNNCKVWNERKIHK